MLSCLFVCLSTSLLYHKIGEVCHCLSVCLSVCLSTSLLYHEIGEVCTSRCSLVFKLTDFGATREMSQHVAAQTLYGTEEYLVPRSFLPRDAMLARGLLSSCVRPSVCPSQADAVPKRRITQTTPYDSLRGL